MSGLPYVWPPARTPYVPLEHATREINVALKARHDRTQEILRSAILAAHPVAPAERVWLTVTLPREGDASEHPRAETVMVPSLRELAEERAKSEMREEWLDDAGRAAIRARVYAEFGQRGALTPFLPSQGATAAHGGED